MSATDAVPPEVHAQTQEDPKVGRRVFIGNLAYTATADQVRDFIAAGGGKVESLELVTRSDGRAAGYAFAVWSTVSEAEAAVQQLDKKSLQEREISVAIAKARSDKPRGGNRRKGTDAQQAQKDEEGIAVHTSTTGEKTDGSRKKKNQRKKRATRRLPEDDNDDAEQETIAVQAEVDVQKKPKAKRSRKPKAKANKEDGEGPIDASAGPARIDDETTTPEASQKQPDATVSKTRARQPRITSTGQPSTTLVFVANLPFSVDDAQLAGIFKDLDIGIKSAKVITKPGFRKKSGDDSAPVPSVRSKGFGFVDTNDEEQQKLALEKLEGYKIQDREIVVKVANERQAVSEDVKVDGDDK